MAERLPEKASGRSSGRAADETERKVVRPEWKIVYNSALHSSDGYPQYSVRLGDYDLTTKMRLNAATGVYSAGGSA